MVVFHIPKLVEVLTNCAKAGNFTTIINWLLDRKSQSWSLLLVELFDISLVISQRSLP